MTNKSENRKKYLVKNTILFAISSFGSKLISFFLVPLYTNVLSTSDYGTVDLISTTSSLLLFIFTLNISSAVLRYAIDDRENQEGILIFGTKIIFIGTVLLGAALFAVSKLQLIGWGERELLFLLLLFVTHGFSEMLNNYLRAIDKVGVIVISSISSTLTVVLCNITFLLGFKIGLTGYLLSLVLGNSVACIISLWAIKPWKIKNKKLPKEIKGMMLRYAIPLIFNGIAWWINTSLDKYFILAMLGTNANGIYAVASKIPSILNMCLSIFMQAWNLSAIKEYRSKDRDDFYSYSYDTISGFLVMCASALIIINIPISKIMFAKDFFEGWKYASVLLLAGIFSGMGSFVGSIFSAAKKSSVFAISTVVSAVVNLVLNFILIPVWGLQGAAISTAISFAVIWLIRMICARKFVRLHISWLKEIICYALLILQIVLEHTQSHQYWLQAAIFCVLGLLNLKIIMNIIKNVLDMLKRKKAQ